MDMLTPSSPKVLKLYLLPIKAPGYFGRRVAKPHISPLMPPLSVWPHQFCDAGHEKRRGEQLKWSWHLGCTLEVFHVHSYQDQFI